MIPKLIDGFPVGKKRSDSSLTEAEVLCLEMYHWLSLDFIKIYTMVYGQGDKTGFQIKQAAKRLLESGDAQVYLEDRRGQINAVVAGNAPSDDQFLEEDGSFKPEVLRRVRSQMARDVMTKGTIDNKTFELIASQIIKQGNMKDAGRLPIRVLAEQCSTCRYRLHVEENFEDQCEVCKYQILSVTKFDHRNQLLIKKEEK